MTPRPPRLATRLLIARLHADERDELIGDLDEQFRRLAATSGTRHAARWYWRQAIALAWGFSMRPRDPISRSHERTRGAWAISTLRLDARDAWRSLRGTPTFSAIAILTIAASIGLGTTVFALVDGILLRALPYPDADRLVLLSEHRADDRPTQSGSGTLGDSTIGLWLDRQDTLAGLSPYSLGGYTIGTRTGASYAEGAVVGGAFFPILGVEPLEGRLIQSSDLAASAAPVVVVSERLRQRALDRNSEAVGQTLVIEETPHVVIGVMPAAFAFPSAEVELWVPGDWSWPDPGGRRMIRLSLNVIARMRPGATIDDVRSEGSELLLQVAMADPAFVDGTVEVPRLSVVTLREQTVGSVRTALVTLLAGVALVLIAAGLNLANLLLARQSSRRREMAVRLALGGTRWRVMRPVLLEQTWLAACGGLAGGLLSSWLLGVLPAFAPADLPRLANVGFSVGAAGFGAAAALVIALVVTWLPALAVPRAGIRSSLMSGTSGRATPVERIRGLIVAAQIALAVTLLLGASLVARSLWTQLQIDPGYDPSGVLTVQLNTPTGAYQTDGRLRGLYGGIEQALAAHPAVTAVGYSTRLPLHWTLSTGSYRIEGRDIPVENLPRANNEVISAGYLDAIGARILTGRGFSAADTRDSEPVVLINDVLMREQFPGDDPLRHRLQHYGSRLYQIVGVVQSVRVGPLTEDTVPTVYLASAQQAEILAFRNIGGGVAVRATGDPAALVPFIRDTARRLDPGSPVFNAQTLDGLLDQTVSQPRFYSLTLGIFATLVLLTAVLGIYGVLAYAVERRRLEFGIRRALGATEGHVVALVLWHAGRLTAVGLVAGAALGWGSARLGRAMLFGIEPGDPLSYAGVTVFVAVVAIVTTWIPARRAALVEPNRVLRAD